MEFHPLANAFPLIEGQAFDDLVKDIEEHGQNQAVVIFENKILDGRNRYRACQKLGIATRQVKFIDKYGEDRDPVAFVVSENIMRRHMDPGALAVAAEKLATAIAGRPRATSPAGPDDTPAVTINQAAKLTGASPTSIKKVRTVKTRAAAPVIKAMERGDLTPTAADNLSKQPKARQIEIMENTPIKEVPAVAARAAAAKSTDTVPEPSGPGRGYVGPKVMLERQMTLPDLAMIQGVVRDWAEHGDVIPELGSEALAAFVKDLRKSRTAYTRLIELIELKLKPAPAEPDKVVDTTPVKVTKKAAPAKAPAKTAVAARKAAAAPAKAPAKKAAPGKSPAAGRAPVTSLTTPTETPGVTGTLSDDAARTLARVTPQAETTTTDKDTK